MILLSFDIEEFDMPFEYGKDISFDDQIAISTIGTRRIIDLLDKHDVKATFFCTATFALARPELIMEMAAKGHEIASHAYYHSQFDVADLLRSKQALEEISGTKVTGFRMPRMMPVDILELKKAGYRYNSSVNPTWLPGRYNNLSIPRRPYFEENVFQMPASVTSLMRFPLFWLSMHNLPLWLYKQMCLRTHKADDLLNIYFHPWEFTDLTDKERFGFPAYVSKNSGEAMVERMDSLISFFKKRGLKFGAFRSVFAENINFPVPHETKKVAL